MSWPSLQRALQLASDFPDEVEQVASAHLTQSSDPDVNSVFITILLRQLNLVIDFVEEHLSHGTRPELSDSLAGEIRDELDALGLTDWSLCMSHGGPNNFVTTHGDIAAEIYGPLSGLGASKPEAKYALLKVPRIVGSGVLWRPVLLGHEISHVAVRHHNSLQTFGLDSKFDFAASANLPNPKALDPNDPASVTAGLYAIAESWAVELLCDAQALRRFGPAAISALAEYLTCIDTLDDPSPSHPPGHLRIKLMEQELGPVADARLADMLKPWLSATPASLSFGSAWADHLAGMFLACGSHVTTTVAAIPGTAYDWAGRADRTHRIADDFAAGLTAQVVTSTNQIPDPADPADVVNAAWISRREGTQAPYDKLAQKSLQDIHFVRSWVDKGGVLPADPVDLDPNADLDEPAILAASDVSVRLARKDQTERLEVRPLLHAPAGSGVDLRLGSHFIVFKRRGIAAFDPLDKDLDPRLVQQAVELAPGETLVLHPNEIVLGATLEYLSLPQDLSAQVITRSSYGRLGLLTATAVQVHAGFQGCLTLELVNLSTIPITLTPGERIAQLVLWRSTTSKAGPGKYNCPTGPEFSKVRDDPEAEVLLRLRS